MTKPTKVTNAALARWRFNPTDRNANALDLKVLGITATISTKNEISFLVRMTMNGVRLSRTVGHFSPGEFEIEQAMQAATKQRKLWRDIAEGTAIDAPTDIPIFSGLLDRWEKVKADSLPRDWTKPGEGRSLIEKVYEPILSRGLLSIHRSDLEDCATSYLAKRMKETGKRPLTSIRRAYNTVKPILTYARDHRWTRPELLTGWRTGLKKEKPRTRVLTPREWQLVAPALDGLARGNGVYLRFLLLTAARLSMPASMRWKDVREIDVGTHSTPHKVLAWCVPASEMKGGYEAVFPLVGDSKRIVEQFRADAGGNPKATDFVFPDSPRNAWINNADRWQKIVFAASGTKGWHRHDLRRTAASLLRFVGANMESVKLLLDHRERDDDGTDTPRYVVIDDNRPALRALAGKLEEMHALLRQIEDGRDSEQLRELYSVLRSSPKTQAGFAKAGLDLETMLEIEPNAKHGKGKVRELRQSAPVA